MRVLIIEDNQVVSTLYQILLESVPEAWEVTTARTLAEGMASIRLNDPCAVMLDLNLPDSDGLDSVRRMRAEFPTVAVAVVTGSGVSEEECIAAGADAFRRKPTLRQDLIDVLSEAMAKLVATRLKINA